MARPFLTADWKHLCLVTYDVPRDILEPYLPTGLELDERDGKTFVSLVAFNFLKTRVFGIAWPHFRAFPELNLRTYVRQGKRRGVLFLREIVSSRVISWIARRFYNEPYCTAPLRHTVSESANTMSATCELNWLGKAEHITIRAANEPVLPAATSLEHFVKELRWGFGSNANGKLTRFEVEHPEWQCFPVREVELSFDFARVYGPQWCFLNDQRPVSVQLVLGSGVKVYPPRPQSIKPSLIFREKQSGSASWGKKADPLGG